MFLLRSAFWLTIAFVVIAPRNADLGATVSGLTADAMAAGQKAIISQILQSDCTSIECAGGKGILQILGNKSVLLPPGTKSPSVDSPMQDASSLPVPLPRPRPDRMG